MKSRIYWVLLLLVIGQAGRAQKAADTGAIIKEFNKVMSFAVQPYLQYSSITSMRTTPLMNPTDSGRVLRSHFYKYGDDLYYGNDQEEIYLQDSLMIQINHAHKSIQVSKVDVASKKKMDILPLKRMDAQRMLRGHYAIVQMPDQGDTGSILIRSQERKAAQQITSTEMLLVYDRRLYLPLLMEVTIHVLQQESEQVTSALKSQGFDIQKMALVRDGQRYLEMNQTASISFGTIGTSKEMAMQMPSWKSKIAYDDALKSYSGQKDCEGYEIIKTF